MKRGAWPPVRFLLPLVFFLVFAGGGALQGFLRTVLPADWGPLKVTSLLAVLYFSFMIWRLLIPASQRFFGDKRSLVLAAAAYGVMPLALFFTSNYWALAAVAAVWGWGAAGLWQTGPVWLYDVTAKSRRGFWAGALYLVVFLALVVGAKVQGQLAPPSYRKTVLLAAAAVPTAAGALVALVLPPRKAVAQRLTFRSVLSMVLDRRVVMLGLGLFASATSYGLVLSAFRDNIEEVFGIKVVGTMLSAYFGVRLLLSITGGYLSDFFSRRAIMAAAFLAGGAALAAAAAHEGMGAFVAAAACMGLVSGVVPVSTTAYAGEWFPPEKRSLALGAAFVWRDAGMVVSLLSAQYLVRASGGYVVVMLAFAALFAICGAASLTLPVREKKAKAER